jgi:hypothetical protein
MTQTNGTTTPPLSEADARARAEWRATFGDAPLPHPLTFSAMISNAYNTYFSEFDEARRAGILEANKMRRDCWLMSLLEERRRAFATRPWHLEVPDESDPAQRQVRDHLQRALHGVPFLNRLRWGLSDALWYGRFAEQVKWRWVPQAGIDTLTVASCMPINGDKLRYQRDGTPYVTVYAGQNLPGAETIGATPYGGRGLLLKGSWRQRFLIHSHEQEDADFFDAERGEAVYGLGIRDRVFWWYWMRQEWLRAVSDFLQRVGLGITVWWYEEGNAPAQAEALAAASVSKSGNFSVVLPRSRDGKQLAGVERVETPVAGADVLLHMVEAVNRWIERYVVGQEASSRGTSSGLGNEANAEFMADTKQQIAMLDADRLDESLTGTADEPSLVWMMQSWTFPGSTPEHRGGFRVKFKTDLEDVASQKKLKAAKEAWEMGATVKEDEVLEKAGLSKPGENDKVLPGKQAAPSPFGGAGPPAGADGQAPAPAPPPNGHAPVPVSGPAPGPPAGGPAGEPAARYVRDEAGHEHKGKGPGGGQFTSKGEGGGAGAEGGDGGEESGPNGRTAREPAPAVAAAPDRAATEALAAGIKEKVMAAPAVKNIIAHVGPREDHVYRFLTREDYDKTLNSGWLTPGRSADHGGTVNFSKEPIPIYGGAASNGLVGLLVEVPEEEFDNPRFHWGSKDLYLESSKPIPLASASRVWAYTMAGKEGAKMAEITDEIHGHHSGEGGPAPYARDAAGHEPTT